MPPLCAAAHTRARRGRRAGCQLTRGAGAGDAAAAGPDLQAAARRPRDESLGLQPLAKRQRRLICRGRGWRKRCERRSRTQPGKHSFTAPPPPPPTPPLCTQRLLLGAPASPMGASLTAPGSMRMDSRHFLALLPECRSKRVKEKSGRPWPPATRCSQEGLQGRGGGGGKVARELARPAQEGNPGCMCLPSRGHWKARERGFAAPKRGARQHGRAARRDGGAQVAAHQ